MSVQIEAEFTKEQIGTVFFVWWGHWKGGLGGGGSLRGVHSQKYTCLPIKTSCPISNFFYRFVRLPAIEDKFWLVALPQKAAVCASLHYFFAFLLPPLCCSNSAMHTLPLS